MPFDTEGRPPSDGYIASGSPPSITFQGDTVVGVDADTRSFLSSSAAEVLRKQGHRLLPQRARNSWSVSGRRDSGIPVTVSGAGPAQSTSMTTVVTAAKRWPIVGREEELTLVRSAFDASEGNGLVVAGAAGVGKTRLASEALREAEDQGYAAAWAVATRAAASIPFGALAHCD